MSSKTTKNNNKPKKTKRLFFWLLFLTIINIILIPFLYKNAQKQSFKSSFTTSESRHWIGPNYWSNPLQDWNLKDHWLHCLVSKKNRNVHVLTEKIDAVTGNIDMTVDLQLHNISHAEKGTNWVGFSIGAKGNFNDYRDDAIFGRGFSVGVSTNGNLFIHETPENNSLNASVQKALQQGAQLRVNIKPTNSSYQLQLSLIDLKTNSIIAQISKNNITNDKLIGDLVLMSNYNNKSNDKSVSFKNWTISGTKLASQPENQFGPILFSQYTLSKGSLKLTAQMAPVILNSEKVSLEIKKEDRWTRVGLSKIDANARTAQFKIQNWEHDEAMPYRIGYAIDQGTQDKKTYYWKGTIQKDPIDKKEIVVAGFTGNNDLGFPNSDIVNQINYHNPDLLFFSGDQIYETVGGYGTQRFPTNTAMLDYLRKWYVYGWAYRDLMKDRPTVCITDDHDVYHGNIWGEGGKHSPTKRRGGSAGQDAGGYMMPAEWVRMVEQTQTSHLPDPYDDTPIAQGIKTYYTDMVYGGISFAILEDRKFKSAPKALLPDAKIKNGWVLNKDFDIQKKGDVSGAKLLGDQQLEFLDKWSSDWSHQSEMKVVLSQTIFANVATLPENELSGAIIGKLKILSKGEYAPNDRPVADLDSNGWPQSGRNKAVSIIRKGFAFHLAGDQHLGSTIQYGVDQWNDAGYALCVPSISNYWPRRWYPAMEGKNRDPKKPRYTGEFKDGFGNKMTVHAVSNPTFSGKKPSRLYDRAAGYGIIRLEKEERELTLECWPRMANPELGDQEQYDGWPIRISQTENYGRKAQGYLPKISVKGLQKPVIEIFNEISKEMVYSLRLNVQEWTPKIFNQMDRYTIKVGEPDTDTWQYKKGVSPGKGNLEFTFQSIKKGNEATSSP